MEKIISLFLITAMLLSLCACSGTDTTQTDAESTGTTTEATETTSATTPETPQSLKVLAIGNSFSVDAMWHLYTIAKAEGVKEIVLGNLFVGSCTLEMHASYIENNENAYRYYKNTKGSWITTEGVPLQKALQDEQWDVIIMQ